MLSIYIGYTDSYRPMPVALVGMVGAVWVGFLKGNVINFRGNKLTPMTS